jgi:hypothetical protein
MAESSDTIEKHVVISVSEKGLEKIEKDTNDTTKSVEGLEDAAVDSTKAIGDMRKQLREANKDLLTVRQSFGETSIEAINAAKKVADLKDQIGDAKAMADAFKPGGGFKAIADAGSLAASGLAAGTGAMAIFGEKSEEVEKTLLKVQAAMALSEGLSKLADAGDVFRNLKAVVVSTYVAITAAKTASTVATEAELAAENQSIASKAKAVALTALQATVTGVATAAQWLWNIAMSANPIGLLVIAITALIAGCYFLIKAFSDSSAEAEKAAVANKKLNTEIATLEKATKKSNEALEKHNQYEIDLAKASGKSSEEVRKLAQELANQEVAEKKLNAIKAQSIFLEARRVASLEDSTKAQQETAKKAYDFFKEQNKIYEDSIAKRKNLALSQKVEIAQEQTDAREKAKKHAEELAKDAAEAAKKKKKAEEDAYNENQKRLADYNKAEKASLDELDKIKRENDIYRMSEDDAAFARIDDKYAVALANAKKFGQDSIEIEKAIQLAKDEVVAQREATDLQTEYDRNAAKFEREKINRAKTIEEQLAFDTAQNDLKYQQEILLAEKTHADKLEITKRYNEANAELSAKAHEEEIKATNIAANAGADALAESFGLAKELAMARMIMAAPEAIGNSFKQASAAYAPPLSQVMGALGAAAVIIPIIKGLADIKKVRFSRSKGGNSGGAASGAAGAVTTAVGNVGANNAARMGVDPNLEATAAATASAKVVGAASPGIVFSEGKYNDFQNQIAFKEGKVKL